MKKLIFFLSALLAVYLCPAQNKPLSAPQAIEEAYKQKVIDDSQKARLTEIFQENFKEKAKINKLPISDEEKKTQRLKIENQTTQKVRKLLGDKYPQWQKIRFGK